MLITGLTFFLTALGLVLFGWWKIGLIFATLALLILGAWLTERKP